MQPNPNSTTTRLTILTGDEPPSSEMATVYAAGYPLDAMKYPVSSSLQEIYILYNQALIGYAVLRSLSSRQLDSSNIVDEGTSEHLAFHPKNTV